jgi:hypothetical protein
MVGIERRFRDAYCSSSLPAIFALMMEAVNISETMVSFYQTIQGNAPEDSHLLSLSVLRLPVM